MPMSVDEYSLAQAYTVSKASKEESGGGEGLEIITSEPFNAEEGVQPPEPLLLGYNSGQYTRKIYHFASKVPKFIRVLLPHGATDVLEESWNAYPYCRTIATNPNYLKERFFIKTESIHLPDCGETENAHRLSDDMLAKRQVVKIDIANDHVTDKAYKEDEDPALYHSVKTGRGPLIGPNWQADVQPVMTCYKLVTVLFKWAGLANITERYTHEWGAGVFLSFHRQLFCLTDEWYGLTTEDIREIEEKTERELRELLVRTDAANEPKAVEH